MSLKQALQRKVAASAISYLAKDVEKKDLIGDLALKIEEMCQKNLGATYTPKVQLDIVEKILVPLGAALLCDTVAGAEEWRRILAKHFSKIDQSLRSER